MGRGACNGNVGHTDSTEGRPPMHSSRIGLWHYSQTPRRVLWGTFHYHIVPDTLSYATHLKDTMLKLRATPTRAQSNHKTFVQKDLKCGTHVFVRHDAVRKPLQRPFDGPYWIIKRSDKHYTLDVKGRHEVISLDRLKPAHLDSSDVSPGPNITQDPPPSTPPPSNNKPSDRSLSHTPNSSPVTTTRSGRHVHWPRRFIH